MIQLLVRVAFYWLMTRSRKLLSCVSSRNFWCLEGGGCVSQESLRIMITFLQFLHSTRIRFILVVDNLLPIELCVQAAMKKENVDEFGVLWIRGD